MADRFIDSTNTLGTITDTDSVYFVKGNVAVDTNLDQSALATGLSLIYAGPFWTAPIGTNANPLLCDVDAGGAPIFTYEAGGGYCYYTPSGVSDVCATLRVTGRGIMNLVGTGTVTTLEAASSDTIVGASITATNINQGGGTIDIHGTGGTAPTTVVVTGGHYKSRRGIAGGGTITLNSGVATFDASSNTIPTFTMTGGRLELLQVGTITTFNFQGGNAANVVISRPLTITTLNAWGTVPGISRFTRHPLLTIGTLNWKVRVAE